MKLLNWKTKFTFGKNWENYIKNNFSQERLDIAKENLLNFLMLENLKELTFLDIGCGSGLHSLAAYNAGAKKIVSFDYDPDSIKTTKKLWELAGKPENWIILEGSVLDEEFMNKLGKFDIVYSWGVLHHTGNMYKAIKNARIPLDDNGVFAVALYSDTAYRNWAICSKKNTPEEWLKIKQKYNKSSILTKKIMEIQEIYNSYFKGKFKNLLFLLMAINKFMNRVRTYSKSRGMEYFTDLKDWLGGWPMDFVKETEYINFCKNELGLLVVQINSGRGNTEFLSKPFNAQNYLDKIISSRIIKKIPNNIQHKKQFMYSIELNEDTSELLNATNITIYEDGVQLGYRNAAIKTIMLLGNGRYKLEKNILYFSTTDNSNPIENGKEYTYSLN